MFLLISVCLICSVACFPREIHNNVADLPQEDDLTYKYDVGEPEPREYANSESGELNDQPGERMGDQSEYERSSSASEASLQSQRSLLVPNTIFSTHVTVVGADGVAHPVRRPLPNPQQRPKLSRVKTVSGAGSIGSDKGKSVDGGAHSVSRKIVRPAPAAPSVSLHKDMAQAPVKTPQAIGYAKPIGKPRNEVVHVPISKESAVLSSKPVSIGRATFPLPAKGVATTKSIGPGVSEVAGAGGGLAYKGMNMNHPGSKTASHSHIPAAVVPPSPLSEEDTEMSGTDEAESVEVFFVLNEKCVMRNKIFCRIFYSLSELDN